MISGHESLPTVLVTGVAGFIGSHLAERLLDAGSVVVGIDNFDPYYDPAVKRSNLKTAEQDERFRLYEGDIRDTELLARIFRENPVTCVYHLAARAGVRSSASATAENHDIIVHGTESLLQGMQEHGVRHLVMAGSSSVYGASVQLPFREDGPVEPINPYGRFKLEAEAIGQRFSVRHGMDVSVCRLFTVYGPRQRPDMGIAGFVRAMIAGRPLSVYNYHASRRDYTHVNDAVAGLMVAARNPDGYRVMNVGSGVSRSLPELVGLLAGQLGCKPDLLPQDANPAEMQETHADIGLARSLGYGPEWTLEAGIPDYVRWFLTNTAEGHIDPAGLEHTNMIQDES